MQTCLVIDDSSVIRKVATRILARYDIAIEEAANGAEALAKLETSAPDLLLVAASLTDMGADDFLRRARALPNGAGTKMLGMLVEGNLGLMTRLKRAGVNGFIYKPFNRESLIGWVEPHLSIPAAA